MDDKSINNQSPITNHQTEEEGPPFYPNHFLKEVMVMYTIIGILIILAILLPFGLHEKADPLTTPIGIKSDWYFLPMYHILKFIPKFIGIVSMFALVPIMLILWPFIDKVVEKYLGVKFYKIVGICVILGMLFFGFLGYISESTIKIGGKKYHFDLKGFPTKEEIKK